MKNRCMLYLDEELIKTLKLQAIKENSSMSSLIEGLILNNYV